MQLNVAGVCDVLPLMAAQTEEVRQFFNPSRTRRLSISNSPDWDLSAADFSQLKSIKDFHLSDTALMEVPRSIAAILPTLRTISLKNNPYMKN